MQACISAARRLNTSLRQHHGDSGDSVDGDNDVVTSLSGSEKSCDVSDVNAEQYHSLLDSINSLLADVKLETGSETEADKLLDSCISVIVDNCVGLHPDADSSENFQKECHLSEKDPLTKTSHGECKPEAPVTSSCQLLLNRNLGEEETGSCHSTVVEKNIDQTTNRLNSEITLGTEAEKSSDAKELNVAKNDVNSLATEQGSTNANSTEADSSVEECVNDEDDRVLVEFCRKKASRENCHDSDDGRELSGGTECDKAPAANEQSDDVLWKEGDIEVRLEIGEDESSNSPTYDDADKETSDTCQRQDTSDIPVTKMPRTSIRISLSKLTARINGNNAAEPSKSYASHVKGSAVRGGKVKGLHTQKRKLRKNRMKLRKCRNESAKTGKLSKTKCRETAKLKGSQDLDGKHNRPEVDARCHGRRKSSQSVGTVFSDTVNGLCTRRRHSTSDRKCVPSLDAPDAIAKSDVKLALRDSTVSRSKKRRGSRGVEYIDIDDDFTSSLHLAHDESTPVNIKKKTSTNSNTEGIDGNISSHADVDANSQPASDKENEKCTTVGDKIYNSTDNLDSTKQLAGKKRRRSYQAPCNRNDNSTADSNVTEAVVATSMEDACTDDSVSIKRSKRVRSNVEDSHSASDNEDKSKMRCTTEEMFRQIGRDGMECHMCCRELRTRRQLLQHAKMQCHLRQKPSTNDTDVDAGKKHICETESLTSQTENRHQVVTESFEVSTDEADKKTDTLHVDAVNGVTIKNCVIEIAPLPEKPQVENAEAETDVKQTADEVDSKPNKAGDVSADCVCDGCGEVVPDCSWLTAHIVTCPGRSGTGDEISTESFPPDASEWSGEQDNNVLVSEPGLEPVAEDAGAQSVEVDAASLLQLLCNVENSLLCTVASENDVGSQSITVVSDSLLQENGNNTAASAGGSEESEQLGREVVHDGVAMYEFAEYRCSMCPVTFLDWAAALRHATGTKVHASGTVERSSIYCCMQCNMRYRSQQLMWYHVTYICQQSEAAAMPADEVHRCAWCSKQFLTAEYLSRHCRIQHNTDLSDVDSQMTLRELAVASRQQSTIASSDVAGSETQKQVLQALAQATMRNSTSSTPKSRKEAALLRSKLVISSNTLPMRRTAKGIVYKNVFMQCIVSYICSNCGRDLSTKPAKREHRVAAPELCFDSGPGGRRLFTYVRHYSYLCPYCNERSATQKACRAHQLATCLPRMGVKTDELNHKQLLCPFCQRKYFNVITLKGHMTLVHQISRAESNQLLAGVTGASEELSAVMQCNGDGTTVNTASLNDDSSTGEQQTATTRPFKNTANVDSVAGNDDDDNSAAEDDDSNSIKSESASHDSRFETVNPTAPLFTSSGDAASSVVNKNNRNHDSCRSSDDSSEDDDVDVDSDNDDKSDDDIDDDDDDDKPVQSPVLVRRRFSTCRKSTKPLMSKTKKNSP